MTITALSTNRCKTLHQTLTELFNIEALDLICLGLGIQIETLNGHNLSNKAISLVEYMEQQRRLNELIDSCQRLRPGYPWDDFRQLVPQPTSVAPLVEPFSIEIDPENLQKGGACEVTINNEDIQPTSYPIKGSDPLEILRISIVQKRQKVASSGNVEKINLHISPKKRPLLGRAKNHTFIIQVSTSAGNRQSIAGQLIGKAVLPLWVVILLSFLSLMVLAGVR